MRVLLISIDVESIGHSPARHQSGASPAHARTLAHREHVGCAICEVGPVCVSSEGPALRRFACCGLQMSTSPGSEDVVIA